MLQLFYPVTREEGLNILRAKLRLDMVRRDASGSITCYTDRGLARRKAVERSTQHAGTREEMFLVVLEVKDPELVRELTRDDAAGYTRFGRWLNEDETLAINSEGQNLISKQGSFSLEIVPGTEDMLATYGGRAPECGAGIGPWR